MKFTWEYNRGMIKRGKNRSENDNQNKYEYRCLKDDCNINFIKKFVKFTWQFKRGMILFSKRIIGKKIINQNKPKTTNLMSKNEHMMLKR